MKMMKRGQRICLGIFPVLLSLIVVPSAAHAASKDSRASKISRERAAKKACLTGAPAKGVEILTDLFIDTGDLTYVFNQGRCFEQNRRYEDAIGRFREYLVKGAQLSDADRSDAEKHIAICQSYLGIVEPTQPTSKLMPAPMAEPLATPQPSATAGSPSSVAALQQTAKASDDHGGSGLRIAGVVTAAIGGAALLSGVILNIKVNSMSSDLEKTDNYTRNSDSTRKDYKTLGWVSYGVGAVCVASGAALYYLGWRKSQGSRVEVALLPSFMPGMTGAMLTGGF